MIFVTFLAVIFYHVVIITIITSFTKCGELSSPRAEDQPQDRREGTAVGEAVCDYDYKDYHGGCNGLSSM